MNEALSSYTVHADRSQQRPQREAHYIEREIDSSPLHLALLVAVVITVLGGATALVEDGSMTPATIAAARTAGR